MKNIKSFTADQILNIQLTTPEKFFSKLDLESEYKTIRAHWHPDKNNDPKSNEVFAHIAHLYKEAVKLITQNIWNGPADLVFKIDNKSYKLSYKKMHTFELGNVYISSTKICYVLKPEFEDLFRNGIKMIQSIKYPNKKFEEEFKKYMPNIVKIGLGTDIGHVLVLDKTPDVVLLQDLLDYLPEHKLPTRHVAWMMSSLINLACFLEFNKISYLGLTSNSLFVSPEFHSCLLYGGWWYAKPFNEKLLALPSISKKILPASTFVDKVAKPEYDRIMIRGIGLLVLGDKNMTGSSLLKDVEVPKPILEWLRSLTAKTAIDEYTNWSKVLDVAYGKRTFVKLDIDTNNIY